MNFSQKRVSLAEIPHYESIIAECSSSHSNFVIESLLGALKKLKDIYVVLARAIILMNTGECPTEHQALCT